MFVMNCIPPHFHAEILSPEPQNVTLFGHRDFIEAIKSK